MFVKHESPDGNQVQNGYLYHNTVNVINLVSFDRELIVEYLCQLRGLCFLLLKFSDTDR